MSESKEKKPKYKKLNVSERYKKYVYDWFGVEIEPESPEVIIPQWKLYRIARIHKELREATYFYFFLLVALIILLLWSVVQ